MNAQAVAQVARRNPELVRRSQEAMRQILARSATDREFRARLVCDPRAAIREHTGRALPEGFSVRFIENTATATIVLPQIAGTEAELSDAELEAAAGGLILAGTIVPIAVTLVIA